VNSFRPCGSDSVFWVLGKPDIITRLSTMHESLTSKPYERVYVRVTGHRSLEPTDGFADETKGYFVVTSILEIRQSQHGECA
jgi:hypothetical protein